MNPFQSPQLWLGTLSFQSNRIDTYESLHAAVSDQVGHSPVPLTERFKAWAERDLKRKDPRGLVFAHVQRRLQLGGTSLGTALRPFVPQDEFLILASSDRHANLRYCLELVIRNIAATKTMSDSMRAAFMQPMVGLVAIVVLSAVFGLYLWPDFLRAVPRPFWPTWTLPCIEAQVWFVRHFWILGVFPAIWLMHRFFLSRWTGPSRVWFDKLPPWSIYKSEQAASFLGVISALVSSGHTVRESLVMIRNLANPYMRWHLNRIIARYDRAGSDSISALRTGLLSQAILDRVEDAAAGRQFDEVLRHVGENSMRLIVEKVKDQAKWANLIFMAIVGALFIYVSMVSSLGVQEATDAYIHATSRGTG